jgi:hypothetical protein
MLITPVQALIRIIFVAQKKRLCQNSTALTGKLHDRLRRLRALLGVAAILLSALAAPVTLATDASDNVCAMACCITDGHCCCKPARPFVKGKLPGGEKSFQNTELSRSCPDGCTTSQASFKIQTRASVRAAIHQFRFISAIIIAYQSPSFERKGVCRYTSPRAPPFSLLSA